MTPLDFKLWRVARGLNQTEAAELFKVTRQSISHWECYGLPINIRNRWRCVDALYGQRTGTKADDYLWKGE